MIDKHLLHRQASSFLGKIYFNLFFRNKRERTCLFEKWLQIPGGGKVYAHIHRPLAEGAYPGIVFVPGGLSPGSDYDFRTEVTADEVASFGFVVLHYDPSGRGKSNGREDYWGERHQFELAAILDVFSEMPEVATHRIGVFSFSIGISIACGALAKYELPFIRFLYDWEGPSNRFNITKNDTHKPLKQFPTSDSSFWKEREAAAFIGNISCDYFRYQAQNDHMQGKFKSHAIELVNGAVKGKASWVRMNHNPPNMMFDERKIRGYDWIPLHKNHKGRMIEFLLEMARR